ncbi:F-box only protein 30-like [Synchiropus splendidus]|uniref:F-box only protein 30-like n=1 Tax=Synchiropus splendidus TaxID=270530 RepID=UPI00237E245C|nr:F-box only protein 30-like [Synchiropus splendidus]XP_053736163.1 F-box only protein 30-like [Synchiropus splendidus]XP_053736164.1 F-box only protein 30-like [Synchiropus splendidus]XP_053736165.1 F-box only protein 30-like [Synchiropus splendidus]XP_053736166.1 F-box only protein 30-like [Synchiropus splendidus]
MEDHVHCLTCINLKCMLRPQPGISCELVTCPLLCGAVFHSCKIDEHQLLCQLAKVPCLNSSYGCPATLLRRQMTAHLNVCPAGVVCCTMEWNRWPVTCLGYTSYETLSRELEEVEQLDVALALQDQRTLLESLKAIALAPTEKPSQRSRPSEPDLLASDPVDSPLAELPSESSQEQRIASSAREKIANGINGLNEEPLGSLYEATLETARSLAAALEFVHSAELLSKDGAADRNGVPNTTSEPQSVSEEKDEHNLDSCSASGKISHRGTCDQNSNTSSDSAEETMEGAPETGSQGSAGPSLMEPVEVIDGVAQKADHVVVQERERLLEHYKPELLCHTQGFSRSGRSLFNAHLGFFPSRLLNRIRPKMEDKAVDTVDLEQEEDSLGLGDIDLITGDLLFSLDESRECRRISDSVCVDGYHVDFGTQTFTFSTALLVTNTRVGDMASASACDHATPQLSFPGPFRTLRMGLMLDSVEGDAVPYHYYMPCNPRYQNMFPFVCDQPFRRDQFPSHFRHVHAEIHAGLSGWMEYRCPLAFYGCTFSQRRLYPISPGGKVIYDQHLRSFGIQPCTSDLSSDQLSELPMEILQHIAGFLDSFSLCQLSLVSRTMREICVSLLPTRGIVELQWEPKTNSGTAVSWQVKNKVWRFSTAFSPVSKWGYTDLPSMSDHLKKCPFNTAEHKTEPFPLPGMCSEQDSHYLRRSLRHINSRDPLAPSISQWYNGTAT